MRLTIHRHTEFGGVTLGRLILPGALAGTLVHTLERPWLDNRSNISRVPPGRYHATKLPDRDRLRLIDESTLHDSVAMAFAQGERWGIDIHVGNMVAESQGCILVGMGVDLDGPMPMVTHSKIAMQALLDTLVPDRAWVFEIVDAFG